MKFKEQFPSMKSFELDCNGLIHNLYEQNLIKKVIILFQNKIEEQIKEHCLDKQKVKEAIEKLSIENDPELDSFVIALKNEFGL